MKIQQIFAYALACLVLTFTPACNKIEELRSSKSEKSKKVGPDDLDEPKKKTIAVDIKQEAKRRLKVAIEKAPPFDQNASLRALVLEKYKIDLNTLFSDNNYDLNKLKDLDDVKKELDERASKAVNEVFPEEQHEKVRKMAEEQYPYYALGDLVEIKSKLPDGTLTTYRGKLKEVNDRRVTVGARSFLFEDIKMPLSSAFDKTKTMKLRNKRTYLIYILPRSKEKEKIKAKMKANVFTEFGFVKKGKKWRSLKRVIPKEIDPLVDKEEKKYLSEQKQRLKSRVYREMKNEGLVN